MNRYKNFIRFHGFLREGSLKVASYSKQNLRPYKSDLEDNIQSFKELAGNEDAYLVIHRDEDIVDKKCERRDFAYYALSTSVKTGAEKKTYVNFYTLPGSLAPCQYPGDC
jgi:hypothetical protein